MSIYIFLLIFILVNGFLMYTKGNKVIKRKFFLFSSFISIVLVVGLRGNSVGEDTNHYLDVFRCAKSIEFKEIFAGLSLRMPYYTDIFGYTDTIEKGYLLLCKFIQIVTSNEQIYLIIIATITYGLIFKFIDDNFDKVFLPTIIILCDFFFMSSFNGIRQLLAVAISIQIYTLLKVRKTKRALIVCFLAILIHTTSIICLVLFPLMLLKPKDKRLMFRYLSIVIACTPLIILLCGNIIASIVPRYKGYYMNNYWINTIGGSLVLFILELFLMIVMYRYGFKKSVNSFPSALLVLMFIALEFAGLKMSALGRLSQYFRVYVMVFVPDGLKYFSDRNKKIITLIFLSLWILLYFSCAQVPTRFYDLFLD